MKCDNPKFRFLLEAPTLSFIHFLTEDGGGVGVGVRTLLCTFFLQRVQHARLCIFHSQTEVQELGQTASMRVFLQGRGAGGVLVYLKIGNQEN